MEQINALLKFQSFAVSFCFNSATDSVVYWLDRFIKTGAPEKRNGRRKAALAFLNKMNQYAQWMGIRPQDNEARLYAAEFMRLSAFGTAEQVWNNAAGLYSKCEKASPAVAMMLPDYNDVMDGWAEKHPIRAEKNRLAHGLRYP